MTDAEHPMGSAASPDDDPIQEELPVEPEVDPLDEAFAAYLRRCDSGDLNSREEFLAQYPKLADQLKDLIGAADLIGRVSQGAAGPTAGSDASEKVGDRSTAGFSFGDLTPRDSIGNGDPSAETVALSNVDDDGSGSDPAATLPMATRAKGDTGPTLPYDLGDYVLLDVIGRGGMGVVYRAHQRELDRDVAVKMIRSGMLASDAEVRRFYTEAQAAARLHHPGIVSVFQFGRRAGHQFFSMEYIRGTDLQRLMNEQQLDVRDAARYVRDVAHAIHHAHERGVLHRDLKPANVLVDEDDRVHVTDFGLAKHMDCDSSVTASGDAVGTPHYMAPEQAGGHSDRASTQSDVYSLGAILFACLAGRPPLVGDTVMQTLVKVVHDPAPPVRSLRADAPADLNTIVAKCLEKKPGKRYASAQKLADELNAFLQGQPIEARPRSVMMRTWHWVEGIPLVAALVGRRVLHSTDSHRRFQAALLCLFLLVPLAFAGALIYAQQQRDRMPQAIRIGGGITGGLYTGVAEAIAMRLQQQHPIEIAVARSGGSLANREALLQGEVDVAPMQATAISGDRLCVIAPLFYEALYVLAHNESSINLLDDLHGHRVGVGPIGSGSRAASELVFDSLGFDDAAVTRVELDWDSLFGNAPPDAAMICIGHGSELISQLLSSGKWHIVAIPKGVEISLEHPALRPMAIPIAELVQESSRFSQATLPTVGTTGFLATRSDAPAELVVAILEALYADPPLREDLIPMHQAAEWQGLAFHPAARKFYRRTSE